MLSSRWSKRTVYLGTLLLLTGVGCATSSSTRAHPLAKADKSHADLSKYTTATVLPFEPAEGKKIDGSIGARFADDVSNRLQHDFGPLFDEVRKGPATGQANELIVTGEIKTYRKGSRFARAMLIGLGSSSFHGDLILKDGADNRVLLSTPFDKLWAWGGILGMSKGIEDMESEAAAAVAVTVARAKGWQPEGGQPAKTSRAESQPVKKTKTPPSVLAAVPKSATSTPSSNEQAPAQAADASAWTKRYLYPTPPSSYSQTVNIVPGGRSKNGYAEGLIFYDRCKITWNVDGTVLTDKEGIEAVDASGRIWKSVRVWNSQTGNDVIVFASEAQQ